MPINKNRWQVWFIHKGHLILSILSAHSKYPANKICSKLFISVMLFAAIIINIQCTSNALFLFPAEMPANGVSSGKVVLKKGLFNRGDSFLDDYTACGLFKVLKVDDNFQETVLYIKACHTSGKFTFRTKNNHQAEMSFTLPSGDADSDGFPDIAELDSPADREVFARWFVRIAEAQFLKRNSSWNSRERDCAGLIRYCFREALKIHDDEWFKKSGIPYEKNIPDVAKFNYPNIPLLGDAVFKISAGNFDDKKSFSSFADAGVLLQYNFKYIGRLMDDAKVGDVLFFFDENNFKYPYHTMIISEISSSQKFSVIYHTGDNDIIKRVRADYLNSSSKFNTSSNNKYFLGIFRFHIID